MSTEEFGTGSVEVRRYMAYDEGCYECGEPSGVLGFYSTEAEAETVCDRARERQEQRWRGQHGMFVIDLAKPEMSEYADRAEVDGQ